MLRLLALALVVMVSPADDPGPIPAAEAKNHLDTEGVFEMTVQLSKDADTRKEYYLDSEADFHDPKNLAIVIKYEDIEAFKKAGINDPSKHYLKRAILVKGTPKKEASQIRIRITDPKFIKVLETKKP